MVWRGSLAILPAHLPTQYKTGGGMWRTRSDCRGGEVLLGHLPARAGVSKRRLLATTHTLFREWNSSVPGGGADLLKERQGCSARPDKVTSRPSLDTPHSNKATSFDLRMA